MSAEIILKLNSTIMLIISGCTIGATGYVLRNLTKSGTKQTYMGYVLIFMLLSQILFFTFTFYTLLEFDPKNPRSFNNTFRAMFTLPIVGYSLWSLAAWFLTFKYWQTAFELRYLFRFESDARRKYHLKIYWSLNCFVIATVLIYCVTSIVAFHYGNMELSTNA